MSERRYRVLLVCTHPVQYTAPILRLMAREPRLDIQVAYCSLQGAEPGHDRDFGVEVKWDVPLLEGYPWVQVPNKSPRPGVERYFGLFNPGIWKLVKTGGYDAIISYAGYTQASFWIALAAARFYRKPFLFGTDATTLAPSDGRNWKLRIKRWIWPRLFGLASVVIVPSTRGVELMRSLGISADRLALTPYVVDNDWWAQQAEQVDRDQVRQAWGVPGGALVILYSAKLQPWKRPLDLLNAFALAEVAGSHLVFAGDGSLRAELDARAKSLGLNERVHFLGFTNQSHLPAVYRGADLMVLPSDYEPFGVVVNEAMLCGCPVIVSDQVGAGGDLISAGQNGYIFPCGNVDKLAALLREALSDRERLKRMGMAARQRMKTWSPRESIRAIVQAVERGVQLAGHS